MRVDADVEVRADRLAYGANLRRAERDPAPGSDGVLLDVDRAGLDRRETPLFERQSVLRRLLWRGAATMGIHPDALPTGAAEELVDRLAVSLSLDVPERDLDGGDRGV